MAGVSWLDLSDGSLGSAFSVGFILIVLTAPMAIERRSVVITGVLPPGLLIASLLFIALVDPSAVAVPGLAKDANFVTRTISTTLDHGLTLLIGHALALAMIVLRTTWSAQARALRLSQLRS